MEQKFTEIGGKKFPIDQITLDELFLDAVWPLEAYFEALLRSAKCEDRACGDARPVRDRAPAAVVRSGN